MKQNSKLTPAASPSKIVSVRPPPFPTNTLNKPN